IRGHSGGSCGKGCPKFHIPSYSKNKTYKNYESYNTNYDYYRYCGCIYSILGKFEIAIRVEGVNEGVVFNLASVYQVHVSTLVSTNTFQIIDVSGSTVMPFHSTKAMHFTFENV
ncbi:hypothetical protein, partial [Salmonella sp. s51944]|uniref:hypothetical protein n=1 Tax=Salmonella sp. s51944 TaxID=3159655 RepID=UPI00397FDE58